MCESSIRWFSSDTPASDSALFMFVQWHLMFPFGNYWIALQYPKSYSLDFSLLIRWMTVNYECNSVSFSLLWSDMNIMKTAEAKFGNINLWDSIKSRMAISFPNTKSWKCIWCFPAPGKRDPVLFWRRMPVSLFVCIPSLLWCCLVMTSCQMPF